MPLVRVEDADVDDVRAFLLRVDLTLSGLDAPTVRLWLERAEDGRIVGCTGYELSADGRHALIRSVAVDPKHRAAGAGSRLARHALDQARQAGANSAWLFSRRSGPFWEKLGFRGADRHELAAALPDTHQVRHFRATGQLEHEVAWWRSL